jgi:hypothetical protein
MKPVPIMWCERLGGSGVRLTWSLYHPLGGATGGDPHVAEEELELWRLPISPSR